MAAAAAAAAPAGPPTTTTRDSLISFLSRTRSSSTTSSSLFACRFTTTALVRVLSPLAKAYAVRLVVPGAVVRRTWVRDVPGAGGAGGAHARAVRELRALGMVVRAASNDADAGKWEEDEGWQLDERVKGFLTEALVTVSSSGDAAKVEDEAFPFTVTRPFDEARLAKVESAARDTWTDRLSFLVASLGSVDGERPTKRARSRALDEVEKLMQAMRLVSHDDLRITSAGYEFMLLDVYDQVWTLVQGLALLGSSSTSPSPSTTATTTTTPECVLRSLFRLSFCRPGLVYEADEDMAKAMDTLGALGLVVSEPSVGTRAFSPSTLGIYSLFKPPPGSQLALTGDSVRFSAMSIIVETTFAVYAYTTSKMHADLLRLFLDVRAILPNVVVGALTRESVLAAVSLGVSARHIISFLTQNAHPLARQRSKIIPDNVVDQIYLWEGEKQRIKLTDGYMMYGFAHRDGFVAVSEFAKQNGFLVWSDAVQMRLFIRNEGSARMREFLNAQKQQLQQQQQQQAASSSVASSVAAASAR